MYLFIIYSFSCICSSKFYKSVVLFYCLNSITYSFYKKADGIIISFDVTDERSFKNISNWIESIKQYADPNIPRVLVGNKIDIQER